MPGRTCQGRRTEGKGRGQVGGKGGRTCQGRRTGGKGRGQVGGQGAPGQEGNVGDHGRRAAAPSVGSESAIKPRSHGCTCPNEAMVKF